MFRLGQKNSERLYCNLSDRSNASISTFPTTTISNIRIFIFQVFSRAGKFCDTTFMVSLTYLHARGQGIVISLRISRFSSRPTSIVSLTHLPDGSKETDLLTLQLCRGHLQCLSGNCGSGDVSKTQKCPKFSWKL